MSRSLYYVPRGANLVQPVVKLTLKNRTRTHNADHWRQGQGAKEFIDNKVQKSARGPWCWSGNAGNVRVRWQCVTPVLVYTLNLQWTNKGRWGQGLAQWQSGSGSGWARGKTKNKVRHKTDKEQARQNSLQRSQKLAELFTTGDQRQTCEEWRYRPSLNAAEWVADWADAEQVCRWPGAGNQQQHPALQTQTDREDRQHKIQNKWEGETKEHKERDTEDPNKIIVKRQIN